MSGWYWFNATVLLLTTLPLSFPPLAGLARSDVYWLLHCTDSACIVCNPASSYGRIHCKMANGGKTLKSQCHPFCFFRNKTLKDCWPPRNYTDPTSGTEKVSDNKAVFHLPQKACYTLIDVSRCCWEQQFSKNACTHTCSRYSCTHIFFPLPPL